MAFLTIHKRSSRLLSTGIAIVASLGLLTACSSGATPEADADVGNDDSALRQQAWELVEPLVGRASAFPITEQLEQLPAGKKIAYLALDSPTEAATYGFLETAAEMLGLEITRIPAGTTTSEISSAANAAVQLNADAVLIVGLDPLMYQSALTEFEAAGIPVIGAAMEDAASYGMIPIGGPAYNEASGENMAAWIISDAGTSADVVFYNLAELGFSQDIQDSFRAQYEELCPECAFRVVDIPLASLGSTAPNTISTDLQANGSTTHAVLAAGDIGIGLPAALERSNLEVKIVTNSPTAANLEYLRDGKEDMAFALDGQTYMFVIADALARVTTGQDLDPGQIEGIGYPVGILQPEHVTFDPAQGWLPYPDYVEQFAELWGAEVPSS